MPGEKLKIPASKGLRVKSEFLYDISFLESCSNIYLNESGTGIMEAEKFVRSFVLNESAQLFSTSQAGVLLLARDKMYTVANGIATQVLGSIPYIGGGLWSCADFGTYVILTNNRSNIVRNISTKVFAVESDFSTSTIPFSNWFCMHRGRLILIGSTQYVDYSGWLGIDGEEPQNVVAWSKINDLTFQKRTTGDRSNMSGYMPMEYAGELLRGEPLGRHIIIYGENGISALTLAGTVGYGQTTIHHTGIIEQGAVVVNGVADGITAHYFIDTLGDLYVVDINLKVTKLGYFNFLSGSSVRMSYNSRRHEVLINFNNDETFVYGANGLTMITGDIESIVEENGVQIIHAPAAIAQDDIEFTTNVFTMGSTNQKYLWGFSANVTSPEEVKVVIYYRKDRNNATWLLTEEKTFDKASGTFNARRLSGVEFKIKFIVEDYTTFQLSDLEVTYSKLNGGLQGV